MRLRGVVGLRGPRYRYQSSSVLLQTRPGLVLDKNTSSYGRPHPSRSTSPHLAPHPQVASFWHHHCSISLHLPHTRVQHRSIKHPRLGVPPRHGGPRAQTRTNAVLRFGIPSLYYIIVHTTPSRARGDSRAIEHPRLDVHLFIPCPSLQFSRHNWQWHGNRFYHD